MLDIRKWLLTAAACFAVALTAHADKPRTAPLPVDMTIDENLASPAVPTSASSAVARHMDRIAKVFSKYNLEVKRLRQDEIVDVVVPCSMLFDPNSTTLAPRAAKLLGGFASLLKLPESYKILVVVHSDSAGSDKYSERLTEARADAIDEFFTSLATDVDPNVIPYGIGNDEPRADNHSIGGREANRRVDFYIIPERKTVDLARQNKL